MKDKDKSRKPKGKSKDKSQKLRPKVVRDSFTMPEQDYNKLKELKARYLANGVSVKKGELLRAGLHALEQMGLQQLLAIIKNVEQVKTGRPRQNT